MELKELENAILLLKNATIYKVTKKLYDTRDEHIYRLEIEFLEGIERYFYGDDISTLVKAIKNEIKEN